MYCLYARSPAGQGGGEEPYRTSEHVLFFTPALPQAKEEVKKIIGQYQAGELEAMPGRSMAEAFENRVNAVLNKARDDAGKKAQNSLTLHVSG